MAHECSICYLTCHCGGDIDDILFNGSRQQMLCTHCDDEEIDLDDIDECDECGGCYGSHSTNCSNYKIK